MSIERPFELQVADLWDSVLNLSLPSEDQLSILDALGNRQAIDELALAFDDAFWVVSEALNRSQLSRTELDSLNELNRALDEMSGPSKAENWTVQPLENIQEWNNVRRLARQALVSRQVSRVQRASA